MPFRPEDVQANRDFFRNKLRAEKQKADVVKKAQGDKDAGDFLLIDARPRDAFAKLHITSAVNAPLNELEALMPQLPKEKELVVYCWNHT